MINFSSQLKFYEQFPISEVDREKDLLIIDQRVDEMRPQIALQFRYVYKVHAGEALKNLSTFAQHVEKVVELWDQPLSRSSCVISCGGGSVGDFSGFLASILKRGLRLIQCPTTWLAAIDSAHGGKTALNVNSIKNQVGTFYPAESVLLIKELLHSQNQDRAREGLSELIKISLISKPAFFSELNPSSSFADLIWTHLKKAIEHKNKIVLQDPYETTGVRKILNFGHTLGHVIESHYQVSHGEGVLQGLFFALEWSGKSGLLSESERQLILKKFSELGLICWLDQSSFQKMSPVHLRQLVMKDKKINSNAKIDFVFLKEIGVAQIIPVTIDELLHEAIRQGWSHDL